MNRLEFMRQLDILLMCLPIHEREEALQYYENYFADAGEENEQAVIEALESPAKVAETIKRDLSQSRGYEDFETQKVEPGKEMMKYQPGTEEAETGRVTMQPDVVMEKKNGLSGGMIALIVVLCIFASPILIGILSVIIGLGAAWISLVISFGAVALSLIIVAVVLAVLGIMGIVHNPLAGVGVIGCGFLLAAVGVLFIMLCVIVAWGVPALVKAIVNLCRGKKKTA